MPTLFKKDGHPCHEASGDHRFSPCFFFSASGLAKGGAVGAANGYGLGLAVEEHLLA